MKPKVKAAAWVKIFEPIYSKSGIFEALHFLYYTSFVKKSNMTARARPGEQVELIISTTKL
jgi:hypothetical protein